MKTHEEWFVGFRPKFMEDRGESTWCNAMRFCPWNYQNKQYAKNEEEARRALDYVYKQRNGKKFYDENGKRYETSSAGYIGIAIECDKETDNAQKIVRYCIKKRTVTEWETIEQ